MSINNQSSNYVDSITFTLLFPLDISLFQSNHAMKRRYRIRTKTDILKQRRLEPGLTQQAVAMRLAMHIRLYQRFEYHEDYYHARQIVMGMWSKMPGKTARPLRIRWLIRPSRSYRRSTGMRIHTRALTRKSVLKKGNGQQHLS